MLFDKAINDIEHGRFEIARLPLQNLINTYDTSEYLAKAKLAIADAWFREGGATAWRRPKPSTRTSSFSIPRWRKPPKRRRRSAISITSRWKSRTATPHALRAEQECSNVLLQFPNSKFAPLGTTEASQCSGSDCRRRIPAWRAVSDKGSYPAAAHRLQAMVDQYPLYSKADEANWLLGDSYSRMGARFRPQAGAAYAKIVRDYPLSPFAEEGQRRS